MTEDTIRTRALNSAKEHWKPILSLIAAVGMATLTAAVTYGRVTEHYANLEVNQGKENADLRAQLNSIEGKLDKLMPLLGQVEDLRTFKKDMEDNWHTAYEQAGTWPRPRKRK